MTNLDFLKIINTPVLLVIIAFGLALLFALYVAYVPFDKKKNNPDHIVSKMGIAVGVLKIGSTLGSILLFLYYADK